MILRKWDRIQIEI